MVQQMLTNDIWRACDIIRSDNNCSGMTDCIEHLSWLIFLKFLDVRYPPNKTDENKPQHPLDPTYRWSEWVSKSLSEKERFDDYKSTEENSTLISFIRQELIPYLATLSGSPERDFIAGLFKGPPVVVCASTNNLKEVLKIIDEVGLEQDNGLQAIAETYEMLLQKLGPEYGTSGKFRTPGAVIQFIVETINPQVGESIYDPCCGTGNLLVAAYNNLKRQMQNRDQAEIQQQTALVGLVNDVLLARISLMNLLLHGVANPYIFRKNALEEDNEYHGSLFDIILANPPFGGRESEQIQQNFPIRSSASELLYLQHIMDKLSSHARARCSIILPEGVLFRHDSSFTAVKKLLLESFNLLMVMSLPAGVFAHSMVKTSVLFFERPGPTKEILYYEISSKENRLQLNSDPILETSLCDATNIYQQWLAYQTGSGTRPQLTPTCWIETLETLVERNYNLSAQNPNKSTNGNQKLPYPAEITAALLARRREFYQILEHLHELVSEHEGL